jgi:hypothetical protein
MAPDDTTPAFRISPRLVLGIGLMTCGVVLTMDSLGLVDSDRFIRFWPLLLIGMGIAKLFQPCGSRVGSFFWILAGLGLLSTTTDVFSFDQIWPLLLFLLGAHVFWRALRPRVATPTSDPTARIEMFAFMGGSTRSVSSDDFKGGSATAVMGGCEIDLRSASIVPGETAVLDCFAMWGGVDIRVPPDWVVANEATAFLGGIEDKSHPEPGSTKKLILTGLAVMGGVEVKN